MQNATELKGIQHKSKECNIIPMKNSTLFQRIHDNLIELKIIWKILNNSKELNSIKNNSIELERIKANLNEFKIFIKISK